MCIINGCNIIRRATGKCVSLSPGRQRRRRQRLRFDTQVFEPTRAHRGNRIRVCVRNEAHARAAHQRHTQTHRTKHARTPRHCLHSACVRNVHCVPGWVLPESGATPPPPPTMTTNDATATGAPMTTSRGVHVCVCFEVAIICHLFYTG